MALSALVYPTHVDFTAAGAYLSLNPHASLRLRKGSPTRAAVVGREHRSEDREKRTFILYKCTVNGFLYLFIRSFASNLKIYC